jgi:ribulose-5-phosphate 4-epimerase/fuculose-1-phosphate aldolase
MHTLPIDIMALQASNEPIPPGSYEQMVFIIGGIMTVLLLLAIINMTR